MKRICILHTLLILLCITTPSWANVRINQGHLTGFLGVDNNPIIKVLNFDGTHRSTQKAEFSWQVTAQCTVLAGSHGTLDIAPTGTVMKGTTVVESAVGGEPHTIGGGPWFPTKVAKKYYGIVHDPDNQCTTDQAGTYTLKGKATITRTGSGSINNIEYLGVAAGTSVSQATYTSEVGQDIDSEVITMTTQTLSESVSGNACRSVVIGRSGSVSLDNGCEGNGTCPTRSYTGSLQLRHGRCGGDGCNCNNSSSSTTSTGSGPGCANVSGPNYCNDKGACTTRSPSGVPGECGHNYCCCAPKGSPMYNGGNSGNSNNGNSGNSGNSGGSTPPTDNTPNCQDCTSDCGSPCSCSNSGTCGGTVSTPPSSSTPTPTPTPTTVACGGASYTGCSGASSRTAHHVPSCSKGCGNGYWTCSSTAGNHETELTCRRCGTSFTRCSNGTCTHNGQTYSYHWAQ